MSRFDATNGLGGPPSPLSDISQEEDDPICIIQPGREEGEGAQSGDQSPTSRLLERASREASQGAKGTPEKRFSFLYDIARNPKLAVAARAEMDAASGSGTTPQAQQRDNGRAFTIGMVGIEGEFFEHAVDVDRSRGIISKVDKSAAEESMINQEMGKVIIIRLQSGKLAAERLLSILQAWKAAEESYAHTMKGLMDLSFASEADGPSLRRAIAAFHHVPSALEFRHASAADTFTEMIPLIKSVVNELRNACEEIGNAAEVAQKRVDSSRRLLRNALTAHQSACRTFDLALKERIEKQRPRALDTIVDPWMTEYKLVDAQADLQSAQMQQRRYLAGAFRRVGELELRRGEVTCDALESLIGPKQGSDLPFAGTEELCEALRVVNLTSDLDSFSAVAEKSVCNGDALSGRQAEMVDHMWREVLSSAEIVRQGDLSCCCSAAQTLLNILPESQKTKSLKTKSHCWVDGYAVLTRAGYLYWFSTGLRSVDNDIPNSLELAKNSGPLGQPIVTLRLSRCEFEMGEAPMWKITDRSGGNVKSGLMGVWLLLGAGGRSETVMLRAQDVDDAMDWTACLREVITIVSI